MHSNSLLEVITLYAPYDPLEKAAGLWNRENRSPEEGKKELKKKTTNVLSSSELKKREANTYHCLYLCHARVVVHNQSTPFPLYVRWQHNEG